MGKRVGAVMASVSCHHRHLDGQYREGLLTRAVTAALFTCQPRLWPTHPTQQLSYYIILCTSRTINNVEKLHNGYWNEVQVS